MMPRGVSSPCPKESTKDSFGDTGGGKASSECPPMEKILEDLNTNLTNLRKSLPPRTALIIVSPHSDPRPAKELGARQKAFQDAHKTGTVGELRWMAEDERALMSEAERAKWGFMMIMCTPNSAEGDVAPPSKIQKTSGGD